MQTESKGSFTPLQDFRRSRTGPFAVEGSTTRPPWVISIAPAATKRRAARRASSMCSRQPSGKTARAASLGQIVASPARLASSSRIATSSLRSSPEGFLRRQASEQNFTSSQQRSHFFLHSMRRPQATQVFSSSIPPHPRAVPVTRKARRLLCHARSSSLDQ